MLIWIISDYSVITERHEFMLVDACAHSANAKAQSRKAQIDIISGFWRCVFKATHG
jgi:hypothetical protein